MKRTLYFLALTLFGFSAVAQHHKLFRSNGLHITRSSGLRLRGAPGLSPGFNHKEHHRQTRKYGQGFVRKLVDGRIRYHDKLTHASKPGEMKGRHRVREWNPATGRKRTWMQTVDHQGRARRIRPVEHQKGHRYFDFDRHGKFLPKKHH